VVFIIDDSGSMGPDQSQKGASPASQVCDGLKSMVAEMEVIAKGSKPYFRISIIAFGTNADNIAEAQGEREIDINAIATFTGSRGSTRPSEAFRMAIDILKRNPGKPTDFRPYVFFFSDGAPDDDDRVSALQAAAELKALKIDAGEPTLWALGYGAIDKDFMQKVGGAERFKEVTDAAALSKLFPIIGTTAGTQTGEAGVDKAIMNY
jgi:uncharacterized protein YegL